jgi:hypothetical protein
MMATSPVLLEETGPGRVVPARRPASTRAAPPQSALEGVDQKPDSARSTFGNM